MLSGQCGVGVTGQGNQRKMSTLPAFPYNTGMTYPRFYCPLPLPVGATVDLPENAARHACRALRLREGDELVLFDGNGGEYFCRILTAARDAVAATVLRWDQVERESNVPVTLVQSLQAGDKMDTTVQKAVELGVARIVPVAARRSVLKLAGDRATRRVEHWRAITASACEQCGRNRLPPVGDIVELGRWLKNPTGGPNLRLLLAPGATDSLAQLEPPAEGGGVELLIGPEGGLAPEEMDLAEAAGFRAVRFGPRVLRTETAGMAALAAIQALWGDFR